MEMISFFGEGDFQTTEISLKLCSLAHLVQQRWTCDDPWAKVKTRDDVQSAAHE